MQVKRQKIWLLFWTEVLFCRAFVLLSLTIFWLGAMKIKDSVEEMAIVLFHNFDLPEEVTVVW